MEYDKKTCKALVSKLKVTQKKIIDQIELQDLEGKDYIHVK